MGAPKQKWTAEEEAALRAGVDKHGAGKWRTILKDPEFSGVLYLRSNVDLKDKWRNMSVMANGWGSREKARLSIKRLPHIPKHDENSMAPTTDVQSDEEMVADAKPLVVYNGGLQVSAPKKSIVRLDNLIIEAITSLKEPGGSNKTTIGSYIEEQYWAPPNFRRILSSKLRSLITSGELIKVKRRYRIAPASYFDKKRNSSILSSEGKQRVSLKVEQDDIDVLMKSQMDMELAKMRTMTPAKAAAAAARAVAEAEVAIAEAEEAAREAEAAEAEADAAQAFAEAALKTQRERNNSKMMIPA
ncbi:telomere repeat-binding factor 1-like isoform X2 [Tripterygium wilfordii]|nr:telomere repeat-binding factor 1-like isoform X2 [Tripterygium wilfordii]